MLSRPASPMQPAQAANATSDCQTWDHQVHTIANTEVKPTNYTLTPDQHKQGLGTLHASFGCPQTQVPTWHALLTQPTTFHQHGRNLHRHPTHKASSLQDANYLHVNIVTQRHVHLHATPTAREAPFSLSMASCNHRINTPKQHSYGCKPVYLPVCT
jgi:hypothetical protein